MSICPRACPACIIEKYMQLCIGMNETSSKWEQIPDENTDILLQWGTVTAIFVSFPFLYLREVYKVVYRIWFNFICMFLTMAFKSQLKLDILPSKVALW